MSTTPEIERLQQADDNLDQTQAQLDALDARERAAPNPSPEQLTARNDERRYLNEEACRAGDEHEAAELAYWRAEGDEDKVRELESNRLHRDLVAAEAAQAIMADLRHQHGDDPDDEGEGEQ